MEPDLNQERQQAHELLDMLPDEKVAAVRSLLQVMVEPLSGSLASAPVDDSARHSLLASRLTLSIASLVPVLGSYLLDTKVYGEIRPAAILFDWILGGLIPASLAVAALALNGETRAVLGWTALGIYGATRVGVIVVGNLHIGEYNRLVQLRLGMTAQAPNGRSGPALLAIADW